MTQIMSDELSCDNDHYYISFWQNLLLSENEDFFSIKFVFHIHLNAKNESDKS